MATSVVMPKLGLTITEGTVMDWKKQEGDEVTKGEVLVEVETDKLTNEVEAPETGTLLKIVVGEGETVPILTPLAYIGEAGEQLDLQSDTATEPAGAESDAPPAAAHAATAQTAGAHAAGAQAGAAGDASGKRPPVSPVAKRLAEEHGIDLGLVSGSGPRGRIQKSDVEQFIAARAAGQVRSAAPAEGTTRKLSSMRKTIARRLSESWSERVHVTTSREIDMTELIRLRKQYNERNEMRCSLTDFLVFLIVKAVREVPEINVSLEGDTVTQHRSVSIGLAVAVEDGLLVPVLAGAERLSFRELHNVIAEKAEAAKTGRIGAEDLTGGTFTVTNLGMFGVDSFTPIINPPESAILGIGRSVDKPMYLGEQIQRRSMCWFSLSFDHRVIDGAVGARFLQELDRLICNPALAVW